MGLDSGVSRFVTASCTITVNFPVDEKGREYVACRYCPYFSPNSRYCQLNKEIPAFPDKNVGAFCPLDIPEQIIEPEGFDGFD